MKIVKSLLLGAIGAALLTAAHAQTIERVQPGFRLINGDKINELIDHANGDSTGTYTGTFNGTVGATTPSTGAFTTLTASGAITATGTAATSGLTCATFAPLGAPAAATDTVFFIATRAYRVVAISEVHAVAAGGASKLQVTKDASTNAPGAGTDLLTNNTNTGFDLNATANTVQTGTLVATAGVTTLAAGDRLAVDFADAIQSSSGIAVTACMAPL